MSLMRLSILLAVTPLYAQDWYPARPIASPSGRSEMAATNHGRSGPLLVFGGTNGSTTFDELWQWDKNRWTQRTSTVSPPARRLAAMAHDANSGRTVLFGGIASAGCNGARLGDTWEWNGTDWRQRTVATSPPARYGHSMFFDPFRQRVMLFGGSTDTGCVGQGSNDIWEWDGTDWARIRVAGPLPSPRHSASAASETANRRVLIFGGVDGNQHRSDTWIWNGTGWQSVQSRIQPNPRYGAAMVFSESLRKTVLFGGGQGSSRSNDTWEFDGSQWTWIRTVTNPPPIRAYAVAGYAAATRSVILFGGTPARNDTWDYRRPRDGRVHRYDNGCWGSHGVPSLDPPRNSNPRIGQHLDFELSFTGNSAPTWLLLGDSNQRWNSVPLPLDLGPMGMPGCRALCSILAVAPMTRSGTVTKYRLAIPNDIRLVEQSLYCQAVAADAPTNATGFVWSNGLSALIGL